MKTRTRAKQNVIDTVWRQFESPPDTFNCQDEIVVKSKSVFAHSLLIIACNNCTVHTELCSTLESITAKLKILVVRQAGGRCIENLKNINIGVLIGLR